jgi:hypothetical protein
MQLDHLELMVAEGEPIPVAVQLEEHTELSKKSGGV